MLFFCHSRACWPLPTSQDCCKELFLTLSIETQNSDHSGQLLLYCLIQERSTHWAEIRLRWQVRANSISSCNLYTQQKNSHFNLFCHEILKHTAVKEESVGRGCSNTYHKSLATWKKKLKRQMWKCVETHLDTPRLFRTVRETFNLNSEKRWEIEKKWIQKSFYLWVLDQ